MKILYDHQIFSYQRFGGISRYFTELMSAIYRQGLAEFDLSVRVTDNEYLRSASFGPYKKGGFEFLGKFSFAPTYCINAIYTWEKLLKGDYDIVHRTFYDPSLGRPRKGKPLVVTVYDMTPERFPDLFNTEGLYGKLVTSRWIEAKRSIVRNAELVLAISEKTKEDVVEFFGISPEKIVVTHLASSLPKSDSRVMEHLPERYILYVGNRSGYKNFLPFFKAMAQVMKTDELLELVCVGGGPFSAEESREVNAARLETRVSQKNVSDSQLANYYRHALAFAFPSMYEGFGIPILEAFGEGCPTLVSRASCFPEIAGDAAVYFDPNDEESMLHALLSVIENASLRAEFGEKGKLRSCDFNWEKTTERTIDAYKRL
jgi:glycosyltransferase involved in cell wall biosynthesis